MHDSLANRSRVSYDPFTEPERRQIHEQMESFLEHSGEDLPLDSVRQFKELLAAARDIYGDKVSQLEALQRAVAAGSTGGIGVRAGGEEDPALGYGAGEDACVGDMHTASVSFGKAPDAARPAGGVRDPPLAGAGRLAPDSPSPGPTGGMFSSPTESSVPVGREAAFEDFKRGEGQPAAQALAAAKAEHKALRLERQEIAASVNAHKSQIDACGAGVDAKSAARDASGATGSIPGDGTVIVDEEEYALLQALRSAKLDYKREHERLRQVAAAFDAAGDVVAEARQQLLDLFIASFTAGTDGTAHDGVSLPVGAATVGTRSLDHGGRKISGKGFGSDHAFGSSKTFGAPLPEQLDESELFEQMRVARALRDEPESLAFLRASKGTRGRARH
jgi:kinesin family protein 6/9